MPDGLDIAAFSEIGAQLQAATRAGAAARPAILPQYQSLSTPAGAMDDGAVKEPGRQKLGRERRVSATGKPVVATIRTGTSPTLAPLHRPRQRRRGGT